MKFLKNKLFLLFFLGLLIRLSLLFFDFSFDVNSFIAWGQELGKFGASGFYDRPTLERYGGAVYPAYPPIAIVIFYLLYSVSSVLNTLIWQLNLSIPLFPSGLVFFFQSRPFLAGLMKLPAVAGDIFAAYMVYRLTQKLMQKKKDGEKIARLSAAMILFNPALIYVSALWGQIDILPTVFVLITFYLTLFTKKELMSWVSFAVALLFKQTAIVTLPLFALVYCKKYGLKKTATGFGLALATFSLVFLPFYESGNLLLYPFTTYWAKILTASGIPFVSNHAFNFWALVTGWYDIADLSPFLLGVSYRLWGILLTSGFLLAILAYVLRKKLSAREMFLALSLFVFAVFLFLTRMHERHFQSVLVFLSPLSATHKNYRRLYIVLTLFYLTNLYHNWVPPAIAAAADFIRTPAVERAMIIVGISCFAIMMKQFFMSEKKEVKER